MVGMFKKVIVLACVAFFFLKSRHRNAFHDVFVGFLWANLGRFAKIVDPVNGTCNEESPIGELYCSRHVYTEVHI